MLVLLSNFLYFRDSRQIVTNSIFDWLEMTSSSSRLVNLEIFSSFLFLTKHHVILNRTNKFPDTVIYNQSNGLNSQNLTTIPLSGANIFSSCNYSSKSETSSK